MILTKNQKITVDFSGHRIENIKTNGLMNEEKLLAIAGEVIETIDKYDGYTHDDIQIIIRMINEHCQVGTYGNPFTSGKPVKIVKNEVDICDFDEINKVWSMVFDKAFIKHYRREYDTRVLNEANRLVQDETMDIEAIKAAHEKVHKIAVDIAGCKATDEAQAAVEAWSKYIKCGEE